MADSKEEKEGGEEPGKKSKLVPILLGVILVVGGAFGVVAMTAPPAAEVEEEPETDWDAIEPVRWENGFDWTFNVTGAGAKSMGRLKLSFDYKAVDPAAAQASITKGLDKAQDGVRMMLLAKTRVDLSTPDGVARLKLEVQKIFEEAFFPEVDEERTGMVTDVYILELLFQ